MMTDTSSRGWWYIRPTGAGQGAACETPVRHLRFRLVLRTIYQVRERSQQFEFEFTVGQAEVGPLDRIFILRIFSQISVSV